MQDTYNAYSKLTIHTLHIIHTLYAMYTLTLIQQMKLITTDLTREKSSVIMIQTGEGSTQ